jgi:hypothetical protein
MKTIWLGRISGMMSSQHAPDHKWLVARIGLRLTCRAAQHAVNKLLQILTPSLLTGLIAVFLLQVRPFHPAAPFRLVAKLHSETAGSAHLTWDATDRTALQNSDNSAVTKGDQVLSFNLPDTTIRGFRLEPLDREGKVTLGGVALLGPDNEIVTAFPPDAFVPTRPELGVDTVSNATTFTSQPGDGVRFAAKQPLKLKRRSLPIEPASAALQFACVSLAAMLILFLAGRVPRATQRLSSALARLRDDHAAWPAATLLMAAAFATVASCFPVIFFGKSFVSPNNGATLLYNQFPTLPQAAHEVIEDGRGADMGATMWAHLPYSVIQHRAIFEDGELPLWNRYMHCGVPLLGQGQSMLGDPLHWIPVAAGGAAWAWDVKFCIAKLIFSFGVGLLVFAATGRLWLAAMLAISSSFLGFFAYRFNHCAFFSLCYAPWILLCWLRVAKTTGRLWPWALTLAAANFWELNSGTAKESAMLIAGLNFTGGLLVLAAGGDWRGRLRRMAAMAFGFLLFVMLGAPHWLVFLDALRHAWTYSGTAKVYQIQPSLLLGLFDDLFYSQTTSREALFNPSANFFILLGCIWAVVDLRRLLRDRTFLAVLLGAVLPAAMAFGVMPPELIARLPFIGSIQHVDDVFSCVFIIHLVVIAAFGLRSMWDGAVKEGAPGDSMCAAMLMAVLAALFLGYTQAAHRAGRSLLHAGETIQLSGFFLAYAAGIGSAVLLMPWIVRAIRTRASAGAFLLGGLCVFLLHFRHGMWTGTKFDRYVVNPGTRSDLAAPSPAVGAVRAASARSGEPVRTTGLGGVLAPGFNAVLGLEHFTGADALINPWQHELAAKSGMPLVWNWRWVLSRGGFPRAQVFGDLWNIRWYLGTPSEQPRTVEGLKFVCTLDLDIYASPTAWPRAFFTNQLAECASLDNFVALLGAADGRPFAADVPKIAADVPPAKPDALEGRTIISAGEYRLTGNSTAFTINAPTPGIAVLGESYEPGNWRVTLDGRPVDCFRVNYAFMGVALSEPGIHKLRFVYWPRVLTPALWIALAGLLLTAGTAFFGMRRRDPAEEAAPDSAV